MGAQEPGRDNADGLRDGPHVSPSAAGLEYGSERLSCVGEGSWAGGLAASLAPEGGQQLGTAGEPEVLSSAASSLYL